MPTFGTAADPSHFVEVPDPSAVYTDGSTQTKRPPAGSVLLVKNAVTLADLTPITTDAYGYWSYTTATGVDRILVSGDNGVTWTGLRSAEGQNSALDAAANANEALANSENAVTVANSAYALAQSAAGGGEYEQIVQSSPGVYPAPTGTKTRRFVGQVRPTIAQGRRHLDVWRNAVPPA